MAGSTRRYVIFGGRGGGEVIAEYLTAWSGTYEVLGLLNDTVDKGARIGSHEVLGAFRDWRNMPDDVLFNIPIHKAKLMKERAALITELGIPDERWGAAIHPLAFVAETARVGSGTAVGAFCDIHPSVRTGRHVGIRSGSYVAHDCTLGDYVFVGAHAAICGYCEIGEGAHIAPSATILEHRRIGRYSVVGAGSLVTKDVGDFEIVAGTPARRIGMVR